MHHRLYSAIAVVIGLCGFLTFSDGAMADDLKARGVVFDDANGNKTRDADEKGIPDVRVSNGREVVATDGDGRYELSIGDDTILFVVKPRGWVAPMSALNTPQFYYIHSAYGSPKLKYAGVAPTGPLPQSVDFPLRRHDEPDSFRVLLFGDPQPGSQQEVDYYAHDVVEELIGFDAAFGVSLGDIVGDAPPLLEPVARATAAIGLPWHYVPGNHDMNYGVPDDSLALESFKRVFGPPYYSFDYGPVHFVVLDNVVYKGKEEGGYYAGLGERQFEFVRNDLARVPADRLVVYMMHIPLMELQEKAAFFELLKGRPHTFSVSAHYHFMKHVFFKKRDGWLRDEPHHHLINVTTCGCWWRGELDEVRLPHATMDDGAPNGYTIATFKGNTYEIEYRASRRPADYQMNIIAPDAVAYAKAAETAILANVFAGSPRSRVEMKIGDGDKWIRMQPVSMIDPYIATMKAEQIASNSPPEHRLPRRQTASPHIWQAKLPPDPPIGTHLIHVRTTDMFGHTYEAKRVIRIE